MAVALYYMAFVVSVGWSVPVGKSVSLYRYNVRRDVHAIVIVTIKWQLQLMTEKRTYSILECLSPQR